MRTEDSLQTRQVETAKAYFEKVDSGELPLALFTPDFEFFFPKYGVGRGPGEFREFAAGLWGAGLKSQHHRDELRYLASGHQVIVEGATLGNDREGRTWDGGKTPGGRFCSVFDFNSDGLISRMFIYLDPDYTSLDEDRFHWKRASARW
jgi:hypothetical protein